MKLSILVCTLNEEYSINFMRRLKAILQPQIDRHSDKVELVINDAGRFMPTGTKRNQLIKDSMGEYFCFIDCDDVVPFYYVDEMLSAIDLDPDVITFEGQMTTNGHHSAKFIIKLGSEYVERNGQYLRWPNHLCAFKRSAVQHIMFEPIWVQEDYKWSKAIKDHGLLKTSVHISKDMYKYEFVQHKPNSYAR